MPGLINLTGQTFGRLTVERRLVAPGEPRWSCRCACGERVSVIGDNLRSGNTTSCGCAQREVVADRNTSHGLSKAPEYSIWGGIKKRCLNPNYPEHRYYADRGITLCDEWVDDFSAFYRHIGPRPSPEHSVDRIDNDRGYEPGNVRWATKHEQNMNTRPMPHAIPVVIDGVEYPSVKEAARSLGVSPYLAKKMGGRP